MIIKETSLVYEKLESDTSSMAKIRKGVENKRQ